MWKQRLATSTKFHADMRIGFIEQDVNMTYQLIRCKTLVNRAALF